jgi:TPR repeat protein
MLGAMSSEDSNYPDAAQMFQEAADLGNPRGMYDLGVLCETGKGVAYSLENAAHWYTLAEKLGDRDAAYRLGTMYEQGTGGMPRDLQKGRDLYQRSGTPEAKNRLAIISPRVP